MRYGNRRATFARVADPIGTLKESLEFDIGTIEHRVHTRPLTRYAGAADISSALSAQSRHRAEPGSKLESGFTLNLKANAYYMLQNPWKSVMKIV